MVARLLLLHALTPLHPGTGQTTGVVDLPVQREVHTGFPTIAATGLKGSLRDLAEQVWQRGPMVEVVFGPETERAADGAGALAVTDARVLAFPVRSFQKVFVWVTCPLVLRRLRRDLALAGLDVDLADAPELAAGEALTPPGFVTPLVLEEMRLDVRPGAPEWDRVARALTRLLGPETADNVAARLVLVGDEEFSHLVLRCTQVSARVALNSRKTTTDDGGSLWYEEALPPETVMYALVLAQPPRVRRDGHNLRTADDVAGAVTSLFEQRPYLQVGGNETVGQGWCRVLVHPAGDVR